MESMRERFTDIASELLDTDPRAAVVLADISADRFTDASRQHPDRVINVGIREQLLVSVGGGLALAGLRPIVHTFGAFLVERPFEQVKLDLTHQDVGAVLVSAYGSFDWPAGGRTHMAPGDVALLDTLDDWTVRVPGHPDEVEPMLRDAVAGGGRIYLRLSEQRNSRPWLGSSPTGERLVTVREGGAGVVVAVGPMLDEVLAATEGLDLTVLYAATVRPFDGDGLRAAVAAAGSADVVLVEPYLAGTSHRVAGDALSDVPHRLLPLGVARAEVRKYGEFAEHLAAQGLDARSLRERLTRFLPTAV